MLVYSLGKNIGVGCHFLLQGIFLTQRLDLSLLRLLIGRQFLYHSATWEGPSLMSSGAKPLLTELFGHDAVY